MELFRIYARISNSKLTIPITDPSNTTINELICKINERNNLKKGKITLLKDLNEGILYSNDKVSSVLSNFGEVICIFYDKTFQKKKKAFFKLPTLVEGSKQQLKYYISEDEDQDQDDNYNDNNNNNNNNLSSNENSIQNNKNKNNNNNRYNYNDTRSTNENSVQNNSSNSNNNNNFNNNNINKNNSIQNNNKNNHKNNDDDVGWGRSKSKDNNKEKDDIDPQKEMKRVQMCLDQLTEKQLQNTPKWMCCPFTKKMFVDPVCLSCGDNFEKKEIESFLKRKNYCPICKKNIGKIFYSNLNLKNICHKERNRVIFYLQNSNNEYQKLENQKSTLQNQIKKEKIPFLNTVSDSKSDNDQTKNKNENNYFNKVIQIDDSNEIDDEYERDLTMYLEKIELNKSENETDEETKKEKNVGNVQNIITNKLDENEIQIEIEIEKEKENENENEKEKHKEQDQEKDQKIKLLNEEENKNLIKKFQVKIITRQGVILQDTTIYFYQDELKFENVNNKIIVLNHYAYDPEIKGNKKDRILMIASFQNIYHFGFQNVSEMNDLIKQRNKLVSKKTRKALKKLIASKVSVQNTFSDPTTSMSDHSNDMMSDDDNDVYKGIVEDSDGSGIVTKSINNTNDNRNLNKMKKKKTFRIEFQENEIEEFHRYKTNEIIRNSNSQFKESEIMFNRRFLGFQTSSTKKNVILDFISNVRIKIKKERQIQKNGIQNNNKRKFEFYFTRFDERRTFTFKSDEDQQSFRKDFQKIKKDFRKENLSKFDVHTYSANSKTLEEFVVYYSNEKTELILEDHNNNDIIIKSPVNTIQAYIAPKNDKILEMIFLEKTQKYEFTFLDQSHQREFIIGLKIEKNLFKYQKSISFSYDVNVLTEYRHFDHKATLKIIRNKQLQITSYQYGEKILDLNKLLIKVDEIVQNFIILFDKNDNRILHQIMMPSKESIINLLDFIDETNIEVPVKFRILVVQTILWPNVSQSYVIITIYKKKIEFATESNFKSQKKEFRKKVKIETTKNPENRNILFLKKNKKIFMVLYFDASYLLDDFCEFINRFYSDKNLYNTVKF
ncbi:broad-complex core protein isoform [Anaeramoeba flamelloides]|uniref:Broad-complex core protein isoform n=1 Tax=Anaeramoeba flamelloides TaxID=1746091 RepID=A0AAV8AHS3_9EUKA|nr:broad-complex core protein isoform [Anaeramoeba flamelloides]